MKFLALCWNTPYYVFINSNFRCDYVHLYNPHRKLKRLFLLNDAGIILLKWRGEITLLCPKNR